MSFFILALAIVAIVIIPILLGSYIAQALRMSDYGWKFSLILFALFAGVTMLCVKKPKLGIDLSGGSIMVFQIDHSKQLSAKQEQQKPGNKGASTDVSEKEVDMHKLIEAVSRRIDRSGLKEITIRPYGKDQIEVIVPNVADREEATRIKNNISRAGTLEFRIVANKKDPLYQDQINLAESNKDQDSAKVWDSDGVAVAQWVPLARPKADAERAKQNDDYERLLHDERFLHRQRKGVNEVLVILDNWNVTGGDLEDARDGIDKDGKICVNFSFNSRGAAKFGHLTGDNLPDRNAQFYRSLGVILDGELTSAPNINDMISDHGVITGSFDQQQVEDQVKVLNAGSLPAALIKEPVSELFVGPTLGSDTIHSSAVAMGISSALVLLFMLWYYRFAGVVANVALVLNMILLVAIMVTFNAAFTLTGLAGLALTVGMAVDNNVLIYERLREELHRGATLRMAIRNAFHRAGTVIIDANLSHLIAATVLFAVGTEQIRGFAITFWLGAVLSMWTALFVARVMFEVAERKQWITKLKMLHVIGETKIDFMNWFPTALTFSILITVAGLAVAYARGRGLFDIDFTGGVAVEIEFKDSQDPGRIREALEQRLPDLAVMDIRAPNSATTTGYLINTSELDMKVVQEKLKEAFPNQLVTNTAAFTPPALIGEASGYPVRSDVKQAAPPKRGEGPAAKTPPKPAEKPAVKPAEKPAAAAAKPTESKPAAKPDKKKSDPKKISRNDLPPSSMLAMADPSGVAVAEKAAKAEKKADEKAATPAKDPVKKAGTAAAPAKDAKKADQKPAAPAKDSKAAEKASKGDSKAAPAGADKPKQAEAPAPDKAGQSKTPELINPFSGGSQTVLTLSQKVNRQTLTELLDSAMAANHISAGTVPYELINPSDEDPTANTSSKTWNLKVKLPPEKTAAVLASVQKQISDMPYFPNQNSIGVAVATGTCWQAVTALVASWALIILYLWIRFQGVAFGLAAVIALIHDVLVMLGAIAFSYYIAKYTGWLGIDQFKINLPIVAAFLTIIGYSVNDTIVVFDRIREVRGKAPRITRQIVNDSTNQTLSRTLLTSFTVFLVVIVLYVFGGQRTVIHGFAFALLVGVATGTYSSIYVAAPILLWLVHPKEIRKNAGNDASR